uniref:Putative ATPase domain containing protein n=1 Tax=viral metagenome TaxID=1070528 RepID=A0A6H1Z8K2_9ZZZZ
MYHLYTIHELLALRDSGDRWLVKNMIPWPGRTLCHGYGSTYKSTVMFDAALSIASGGALLENWGVTKSGPVIILSAEGDIFSNRDRLMMHMRPRDLDPAKVDLHYGQESILVDIPEGRQQLIGLIEHVKPVLLVIDPFVSFFSGDENAVREVKLFLNQGLDPLIAKYNMSCVVIHHSRKDGEIRGSTALQAWADSVLRFDVAAETKLPGLPEPVDVLSVKCTKQRNGGKKGQLFSAVPFIDEESSMISWGLYTDPTAAAVGRAHLKMAILRALKAAPEPMTKSQLKDQLNVSFERISDAADELIASELVSQTSTQRSTSGNGSRGRTVGALVLKRQFTVDQVCKVLRRRKATPEDAALLAGFEHNVAFRVPAGISRLRIPTDC